MKTEKERLLKALTHINDIENCIVDNKWRKYLQDHLIVVEYELQRQLSLINADDRRRIQIGNPEYSDDAKQQRPELPDITGTDR
tara:strand:+ start:388 stop:639 length:252 start_codon:yes stop_codon:yes gene_type:complete